MPNDAIVLTSFGDASINHSTAVGAINSALWVAHQNVSMPIVFICEDNGIGISVRTPQNWLELQYGQRAGLHYIQADGLNLCDTYMKAEWAERYARNRRRPVFLHTKTVRLLGHAGSDVETTYSNLAMIEETEFNDPLLHSARIAIAHNLATADDIIQMYKTLESRSRQSGSILKRAQNI